MKRIYHTGPIVLGGETVTTELEEKYEGPAAVFSEYDDSLIACAPEASIAYAIASYATTPDGGYGSVIVKEANKSQVTHNTFDEWAFD